MACILIAEDDEFRLLVMSEVLEMEGHTVFKALDGSEAWDLLQHHVVDLVLTNYEMPNLNGLELLKRLRVDQRYATLPVIVFTANDAEDLFMTHGATSFLLCPFDLPTFLEVVNRAIDANAVSSKQTRGFSDAERAAMKERAQELKAAAKKADGESAVLAKIAEMPEPERAMAQRLHEIITASAPSLSPKTWYGMPAYANQDGEVVCFFQSAHKFNARYATFGFNDAANLDEGVMWPTAFALKALNAAEEARIIALVKKAVR